MREEHVFPPSSCGLALALSQHLRLTVPRLGLPCAHSQQLVGPEALLRPPTWCGEGQCAEGSKCSWLLSSLLPFLTAWTSCHRPWIDSLHNYFLAHFRRRQWHPSPVLLPGKSHGQRSLVGCSAWGRQELDTTEQLHFHPLEKEMATHSSVLAWRIPGTEEPGGLPSMGSHRVGHD